MACQLLRDMLPCLVVAYCLLLLRVAYYVCSALIELELLGMCEVLSVGFRLFTIIWRLFFGFVAVVGYFFFTVVTKTSARFVWGFWYSKRYSTSHAVVLIIRIGYLWFAYGILLFLDGLYGWGVGIGVSCRFTWEFWTWSF